MKNKLSIDEKIFLADAARVRELQQQSNTLRRRLLAELANMNTLSDDFIKIAKTDYRTIISHKEILRIAGMSGIKKAMGLLNKKCRECDRLIKVEYGSTVQYCDMCASRKALDDKKQSELFRKERDAASKLLKTLQSMPYSEYLKTEHWKNIAAKARIRAGFKCQLCNQNAKLNVHHRHYNTRGAEKMSDLIVLCQKCHSKFHEKV